VSVDSGRALNRGKQGMDSQWRGQEQGLWQGQAHQNGTDEQTLAHYLYQCMSGNWGDSDGWVSSR
jgi:hypothetical protein